MDEATARLPIYFSCYFTRSRLGEQFVQEHTIAYIVSGKLEMNDGEHTQLFGTGDLYFCRRNSLVKYTKYPPEGGEYRSISIFFDQDFLRGFSIEFGYKTEGGSKSSPFELLPSKSVLGNYMESLRGYEQVLTQNEAKELIAVKQKEALLLLLQIKPALRNVLFDFSAPGKIDLEAFMNRNYHFNVELKRFAHLTGRSLSTFKRDFEKLYHTTPSRWLLQRRLQEAYYLLKEKKKQASDVYLDLGFEDLSHFSYVFKKAYGVAPSLVGTYQ